MEQIKGSLAMITNPAVFAYVMKGVGFTVLISVVAVLCGILFGSILAMVRNYCTTKKTRALQWLSVMYLEIFRNTPLLLWIFICLVFCPCPKALEHKMLGLSSAEVKLLFKTAVALILFTSSVIAEIVRGGLNSVAHGQFEAGHSQGFSTVQIMLFIVLPQAFRAAFPALSNSLISMLKGTSLAATITVTEMFREATVINGRVYESLGLYTETALIYLAFCTILTWLQRLGEKKLASYGGDRK